jgi:membrane-associated phospholipid phosphatase
MINNLFFFQPVHLSESSLMFFFSHWFLWILIFGLSLLWLIKKRLKNLSFFWLLLVISEFLHTFLKTLSPWDRPFINEGAVPPEWIGSYSQGSFPSGHAFRSVILLYFLWKGNKKLFWFLLPAVLLVSVGRVLFKLHYPIDILGGYIIGGIVIYLFSRLFKNRVWI